MIDAARFASSFTSFWNMAAPTCEHLVRKINLSLYERQDVPLASNGGSNRALIAEFGFCLFAARLSDSIGNNDQHEVTEKALKEATLRISVLQKSDEALIPLDDDQIKESMIIADRLRLFFLRPKDRIVLRPVVRGCGIIDHSEADVLFDSCIYEVKTVDRPFRGSDLRQVATYAALSNIAEPGSIDSVGLYNPRRGIYFEMDLAEFSREISGKSELDLFEEVYQAISGSGVSR